MPYRVGTTFLMTSGPAHDPNKMHLHIICTDPCINNCQLIVSVATYRDPYDATCILNVGDHPFICRKSYVVYGAIKIENCSTIDNGLRRKIFRLKQSMRTDVLQRVCDGILLSPHTKPKHKDYFKQQHNSQAQIPVPLIASSVPVQNQ